MVLVMLVMPAAPAPAAILRVIPNQAAGVAVAPVARAASAASAAGDTRLDVAGALAHAARPAAVVTGRADGSSKIANGDLIISICNEHEVDEYTPDGTFVQTLVSAADGTELPRRLGRGRHG